MACMRDGDLSALARRCVAVLLATSWACTAAPTPSGSRQPSLRAGHLQPSVVELDSASSKAGKGLLNFSAHEFPASSTVGLSSDWDAGAIAIQDPPVSQLWPKIVASGAVVGGIFGAMGAGASMIMKPLLYYVFDQRPFKRTIFEMYLILIILASLGAARGHAKGRVAWDHVAVVAFCTSGAGTSMGALVARLVTSRVQLLFFGFLVLAVAGHMWQQASREGASPAAPSKEALLRSGEGNRWRSIRDMGLAELAAACGTASLVGLLSGFVGVGGGFMLTPLLCHLGHKMDTAVPTSLAIIALSGGVGGSWYAHLFGLGLDSVNIPLVLSLAAAGCVGLLSSEHIASLLPKATRQHAFALLLVAIGAGVVWLELVAPFR